VRGFAGSDPNFLGRPLCRNFVVDGAWSSTMGIAGPAWSVARRPVRFQDTDFIIFEPSRLAPIFCSVDSSRRPYADYGVLRRLCRMHTRSRTPIALSSLPDDAIRRAERPSPQRGRLHPIRSTMPISDSGLCRLGLQCCLH